MNMGSTLFFWFLILSSWGQCHNAHNITKLQHCFACYSCNRVELSQSIECPKEQNMCMVCTKVVPPPKIKFFFTSFSFSDNRTDSRKYNE